MIRSPATWCRDYPEAENLCIELADTLRRELGLEGLGGGNYRFQPVGRSGRIVLGLLAYALPIPSRALECSAGESILLVDDCAITGYALGRKLKSLQDPGGEIVVATLYSHPGLRQSIVELEPRVSAFYSARDLPETQSHAVGESDDFARRWSERLPGPRYAIPNTGQVAFPWSHSDWAFWSEADQDLQKNWRYVSPHLCFRNHCELRLSATGRCASGYRLPDGVCYRLQDGRLELADIRTRRRICLEEAGVDIVRGLLTLPGARHVARELCGAYDATEEAIFADVVRIADELAGMGLLDYSGC